MNPADETFLRAALDEAQSALEQGEVPVGAALVRDGEIVVRAHNECERRGDATAHAELLCLQRGMALLGSRLTDCTLYVTLEPCAMCAGACVNAKLGRLVFGAFDEAAGCCSSRMELLDHCFLHSVEVWGGVLERACAEPLGAFFRARR